MRFNHAPLAITALLCLPAFSQPVWVASTSDGYRQIYSNSVNVSEWPQVQYTARLVNGAPDSGYARGYAARRVQVNCANRTIREALNDAEDPRSAFGNVDVQGRAATEEFAFVCNIAGQKAQGSSTQAQAATPSPAAVPQATQTRPPSERAKPDLVASGSGFVVSPGRVVTNNHVVEDCRTIAVRHGAEQSDAKLQARSESNDLAILQAALPKAASAPVRASALLGEEVMAAGYPLSGILASDLIVTSGQVNALAGLGNDPMRLQISAPVQAGNSGGPLFDKSGNIVGVVVSKLNVGTFARVTGELPQNVNFAIKPEVLRMFLDANQVPVRSSSATHRLDGTQLAALARRASVQVLCLR